MFADALQLWLALCRRRAELRRVEALLIGKTSVRRQRAALCAWQGEIKYIQLLDGARAALSRVAERVWLSWVLADWREALRVDELDKGRQARWKVSFTTSKGRQRRICHVLLLATIIRDRTRQPPCRIVSDGG
jgi:hypothetical protein